MSPLDNMPAITKATGDNRDAEGLVDLPSSVGVLTVDLKRRTYMLRWFRPGFRISEYSIQDKMEVTFNGSEKLRSSPLLSP